MLKQITLQEDLPLVSECAKLQGFPPDWCDDIPHSDSAEYKLWGNGIALPCIIPMMQKMAQVLTECKENSFRILVACEESQRVCSEFRKLGYEAYSCDITECSGNHLEWHIKGDILPLLNGNCEFTTMDGCSHKIIGKWDMLIAFPPCTHLAVSGAKHYKIKREDGRQREGIEFFCQFLNADCDRIVVENPVNIISGNYVKEWFPDIAEKYGLPVKPSCVIQPYEHGDHARKKTCLWLKGLPNIVPTNIVDWGEIGPDGHSVGAGMYKLRDENGKAIPYHDPRTAKIRSKTFPGIAKAMAKQWGDVLKKD